MAVIQAYKSESDGLIFEHFHDYQKHLRTLAALKGWQTRQDAWRQHRQQFVQQMFDTVSSPQELIDFIHRNAAFFIDNYKHNSYSRVRTLPSFGNVRIISSDYMSRHLMELSWDNKVSNSHSAPQGQNTNWCARKKHEATSYPGWRARICFTTSNTTQSSSSFFKDTGINLGTGGGGSAGYTYDIELFAQDFRKMAYHEMLADFEKTRHVDLQRIIYVLDVSRQHVDFCCPRLKNMLEIAYEAYPRPELYAAIMEGMIQEKHPGKKPKV